jgi:threonine synthase
MVQGFGLDETITTAVFNRLRELSAELNTPPQISAYAFSPEGMRGVESIAFEIAEALPDRKARVFSPAGGGGLTLAVGRGFLKWEQHYPDYRLPALYCVQPEGNDTIAGALIHRNDRARPVPKSTTAISGLQVPGVIDGHETINVCRQLNGGGELVPDRLAFQVQRELATLEGIYCEPAGAVALAGAIQAKSAGKLPEGEPVICLVTGHGFKDPASIQRMIEKEQDYFSGIEDAVQYIRQESNV